MAWTTPRTWNVSELVTAALMNTHVRDNLNYLKEQIDTNLANSFRLVGRRGGSATDWATTGTTNYTPATAKIQVGAVNAVVGGPSGGFYSGSTSVTFPVAFAHKPVVIVTPMNNAGLGHYSLSVSGISTTGFAVSAISTNNPSGSSFPTSWIAIGD
jgi:hypothetical protein